MSTKPPPFDVDDGEILDAEEEALMVAREAEIAELDRQGKIRPVAAYLAESRAKRMRRAG